MSLGSPIASLSPDSFRPLARIGSGGQAEILLALQLGAGGFEKLVVIKRLWPHLAEDERQRRRLEHEARLVARIQHPNVCQVLNLIAHQDGPLLVLEYLNGVTAAAIARIMPEERRVSDVRLACGILQQTCEGLHSAHEMSESDGRPADLVHRDVTSSNLLVLREGVVKVLDFGLAKSSTSEHSNVRSLVGTAAFMSPEQVEGHKLDRRSDIFSLGVVAYEALTGKGLFRRKTVAECWDAVVSDQAPVIGSRQPALPPPLESVLRKALAKDRGARFPTARAFGDALSEATAEIGGPMRVSEISEHMESHFADALVAQEHQVQSFRQSRVRVKSSKRVSQDCWAEETLVSLPSVEPSTSLEKKAPLESLPTVASPKPITNRPAHIGRQTGEALAPIETAEPATQVGRRKAILLSVGLLAMAGLVLVASLFGDRDTPDNRDTPEVAVSAPASDAGSLRPAQPSPGDPGLGADAGRRKQAITPADASPSPHALVVVDAAPKTQGGQRPKAGPPGYFSVASRPFATIVVDGKRIGHGPIFRHPLRAGRHRVVATTEDGRRKRFTITIKTGEELRKRVDW